MMENKKLCEEILWWAKFLASRGVNPKFVCANEETMAKYEETDDE